MTEFNNYAVGQVVRKNTKKQKALSGGFQRFLRSLREAILQ